MKQNIEQHNFIVLKIEDDQADIAVTSFGCTYARTKVALCPPAVAYFPYYWFTRCSIMIQKFKYFLDI